MSIHVHIPVSIAKNKFGCFKEIYTSSFNGQILWILVTIHYYGTFEVQYNSVLGDHTEPISTMCWLFLQASIKNIIVKHSNFINRNQSTKLLQLHAHEYLMNFKTQ